MSIQPLMQLSWKWCCALQDNTRILSWVAYSTRQIAHSGVCILSFILSNSTAFGVKINWVLWGFWRSFIAFFFWKGTLRCCRGIQHSKLEATRKRCWLRRLKKWRGGSPPLRGRLGSFWRFLCLKIRG